MELNFWDDLGPIDSIWERLRRTDKPIALYGMGLGAEKIMRILEQRGLPVSAVFASDGFVRGHSFHGFPVLSLSELVRQYPDPFVLISFGSQRPEVLEQMKLVAQRFETAAPDVPVAGDLLFTPEFLKERAADWEAVYAMLADQKSRDVFLQVIRYKLDGDIARLFGCESDKEEVWETLLRPGAEETFVDLGAYTGDTVREFLSHTGNRCRAVVAMEPDAKTFRKLERFAQTKPYDTLDIRCYHSGAWDRRETLAFRRQAGRNSAIAFSDSPAPGMPGVHETLVQMEAPDHLVEGLTPSIVKLDVEGAEHQALLGCAGMIRSFHPRLMVSAYHRSDDLIDLPLLIRSLYPGYRMYLRHHPYVPAWETNFYCLAEE